jgi:hypothetical protein
VLVLLNGYMLTSSNTAMFTVRATGVQVNFSCDFVNHQLMSCMHHLETVQLLFVFLVDCD